MEKVTETPVFVLHLWELFQILNQMLKHISLIYSYEKYYKHLQMTTVQIILTDYRLYDNVHEKITRFWSAENECKVETRVQVTNSVRTLPKFMSVFTFCDVFRVH